jgi:mono/diheme cytochrome c family protein
LGTGFGDQGRLIAALGCEGGFPEIGYAAGDAKRVRVALSPCLAKKRRILKGRFVKIKLVSIKITGGIIMKFAKLVFGAALATTVGAALAVEFTPEESLFLGMKIYERAAGRGCGTCHDVRPFPDLSQSIKKLSKEEFLNVVKNGRPGTIMVAMAPQIMSIDLVKKACMTEDQALDALYAYLKSVAEGKAKVEKPKTLEDKIKSCGK